MWLEKRCERKHSPNQLSASISKIHPRQFPASIINKIAQGIGSIKSVTSKGVLRRSCPKRMIVPWYKLFEATIQNQAFISSLCRDGRLQT
jgi:hypothetical protein